MSIRQNESGRKSQKKTTAEQDTPAQPNGSAQPNGADTPETPPETPPTKSKKPLIPGFNLEDMRAAPNYDEEAAIRVKTVTSPPEVRKAGDMEFFRTHPDYEFETDLAKGGSLGKDWHMVAREVRNNSDFPNWPRRLKRVCLRLCVTYGGTPGVAGTLFIWPVVLPNAEGDLAPAQEQQADAVDRSITKWTNLTWDGSKHIIGEAEDGGELGEPVWPEDMSEDVWHELIEKAFKNRYVDKREHPYLKKVRGNK